MVIVEKEPEIQGNIKHTITELLEDIIKVILYYPWYKAQAKKYREIDVKR